MQIDQLLNPIFLVAIAGLISAILTIRGQRRIAARRAAFDIIVNREVHDPNWAPVREKARELIRNRAKWNDLIQQKNPSDFQIVSRFLNHHEFIAIGIAKHLIDEATYYQWGRTRYVEDWKRAVDFIGELRVQRKKNTALSDFEALALRWEKLISSGKTP